MTGQVHLELYIAQTGACWNTLPQSRERRGTGKQKREKERTPARMGSKPRAHKRHPPREGDHEVYRERSKRAYPVSIGMIRENVAAVVDLVSKSANALENGERFYSFSF